MQITWQPSDDTGRSGLLATVEHYDAVPPISRLLMDGSPRLLTAERLGCAAALVFGRYCSGTVTLPRPVGPGLAHAVAEHCAGSQTVVGPIVFEPAALPLGATTLVITGGETYTANNTWGRPREMTLDVRRSDTYAGQLASMNEFVLASNAWLHSATEDPTDIGHYLGELAIAVLFSESLQVDRIALPADVDLESDAAHKVRGVLAACRLGLTHLTSPIPA